jgi:hypothetical protein
VNSSLWTLFNTLGTQYHRGNLDTIRTKDITQMPGEWPENEESGEMMRYDGTIRHFSGKRGRNGGDYVFSGFSYTALHWWCILQRAMASVAANFLWRSSESSSPENLLEG